jgi:hypothetical protein
MSVATSVVLATVRTFLNDDAAANWTDAALMPKLQQAHRELQVKLRRAAAPVMKGTYIETIPASGTAFSTPPVDLIAPIQLWENAPAGPLANYQLMTESDPLPNVAQVATLVWWAWVNEVVTFIGSSASRMVKMVYWKRITVPQANTDLIGFIDGELYLAPRTAAIAYGSTGDGNSMGVLAGLADASLSEVILSNRGRAPQAQNQSQKP